MADDKTKNQKEETTHLLKTEPPKKQKKAVIPSKIIPKKEQLDLFGKNPDPVDTPITKQKFLFKKSFFVIGTSLLFLALVINLFHKPFSIPHLPLAKNQYIYVKLPSESLPAYTQPDTIKAKLHYEKAKLLISKDTVRHYKEAIFELERALEADPSHCKSLSLLSLAYLYLWELSTKNDLFLKPIHTLIERAQKNKNSCAHEIGQAEALWYYKKGGHKSAQQMLDALIQENPYDGFTYLIKGEMAYETSHSDQGIKDFEKALELDPQLSRAHYLLGRTYQQLNQPEKAYENFWMGLNLHPDHSLSRLEASLIDIQTFNNLKKAEENLRFITQFPSLLIPKDLARAHYHLGWIYEEKKELDSAFKNYQKAQDLDPIPLYRKAYTHLSSDRTIATKIDSDINEESRYFVIIGNRYMEADQFVDALAQYQAAIQTDPKNYVALYQLGMLYEKMKKRKKALEAYEKAIHIKGNYIEAFVSLVRLYIDYFDFEKASFYIEKIKELKPLSFEFQMASAFFYQHKGEVTKAMHAYMKAIEINPRNFESHFNLALLFLNQKEYKKAEKYFFSANAIRPDDTELRINIAKLYFERGLKSQAVDYLKKLIQAYPLNPDYYAGLATIYFLAGDTEFSKEWYLKAFKLKEDHVQSLEGLATVYKQLQEYPQAIATYKKLTKIDATDAKWYFEEAKLYSQLGNHAEALKRYKLVTQINFRYPLAHYEIARIALLLGEAYEAEQELKTEIKINSHLKEPYLSLGNFYAAQGRYEEAQEYYEKFIRIDPNATEAYLKLAAIHSIQKKYESAIEFYKTALEKDSNLSYAYLQLGIIYKDLNQKSDAIEAFENYLRAAPDAANVDQIQSFIKDLKRY